MKEDIISEYKTFDKVFAVTNEFRNSFLSLTGWSSNICIVVHNPVIDDKIWEKSFD